jgi:diguanylate cyclase (GGDEF)-like protein
MQRAWRRLTRSPGSSLTVLGVMLSLAIVILFLTDLATRYRDAIATAKTDAQSFAKILADHAALTFEDVDRVLLEAANIRRDSQSGQYADPGAANAALRQLQKSSSVIIGVGWTDASGDVLAHSADRAPQHGTMSGMAQFTAQRDSVDDQLFIAPPFRSAAGDKWLTAASRRLSNADGSFAGIVGAALDQSYFLKIYRSIDLGHGGSVVLMHREGRIMARRPQNPDILGRSFANGPLFTKYLPMAETGSYELVSPVDGVARIAGYQAVSGLPLILIVTYARNDVLQQWYRHVHTFGPLVAAMVVIILLGTFLLARQSNALAAKKAHLARINARVDVAINNMSHGLCLFDVHANLVISNSRYQKMYDLPDELVRPGTPLKRILQHYVDRGETSNLTVDQYVESMPTQRRQEYQWSDGRTVSIRRTPLPDGGWVATHEDVTEQKRAAELLAQKAVELEAMNVRFDAAINHLSHGLCMFDAEQKLVVSNPRYGEIYHLSSEQIKPGTSRAQILEYRREKGTDFRDVAPEVHCETNVKEVREVRELVDGRVIAIARQIMADGSWLSTHEDITDRARNEKKIAFMAQHDLLTGLANRTLFSEKLAEAAKRLRRYGMTFTVLMLDLDRFKAVNDTLGHAAGDQLLVEVARRLSSSLRDTDVLARLGGDEFAIIQENEKDQSEGAIALALGIIGLIEQPFDLGGNCVSVGTSVGIAFAPEHGADADVLLQKADVALYAAKSAGRNDFRIFQPEMTEAADAQKSMEGELREAMARNEFELHYQPVIDAGTRAMTGLECFVRWHHPSKGVLEPSQFLDVAEQAGLMLPLGEWILRQACLDAAAWPAHIKVAVNMSAAQFHRSNVLDVVLCALVESGLSPRRLEFEIPDAALLEGNLTAHLLTVRQLKNLGVGVVLDNCGVGYSAASYLQSFPFDKFKIDRAIVQGCTTRRDCAAVVASAVALARGLDVATVAKGVENRAQFEALLAAGVDFAQGYLIGRPVPNCEISFDSPLPAQNVA